MRTLTIVSCFLFLGCGSELPAPPAANRAVSLAFGPEIAIGETEANPSTPFLRHSPDGRLFAVWTEDHETPWPQGKHSGGSAPSPMRNALSLQRATTERAGRHGGG